MTNGQMVLIVGGAALGGLILGGALTAKRRSQGFDHVLRAGAAQEGKSKSPDPPRGSRQAKRACAVRAARPAKSRRKPPKRPAPDKRHFVPIHPEDPVRGPESARITIISFTDFQCPFCARAARTMDRVHRAYGDAVRIVLKHHPLSFHRDAPLAHQASAEAHAQGKFWAYHDRLFANSQPTPTPKITLPAVANAAISMLCASGPATVSTWA